MEENQEHELDSTTNKLILLYLFERIEIPLTENSIMDICTNRNNWLKYMDCKVSLEQLIDSQLVYSPLEHTDEPVYTLTYEGRNCLSLFFHKVPSSIREGISSFAKINLQHIKRKQEYVSRYEKMADGSYLTTFTIKDPHLSQSLFEMKVKMENRSSAISASKKWVEKAPDIYEYLYLNLFRE